VTDRRRRGRPPSGCCRRGSAPPPLSASARPSPDRWQESPQCAYSWKGAPGTEPTDWIAGRSGPGPLGVEADAGFRRSSAEVNSATAGMRRLSSPRPRRRHLPLAATPAPSRVSAAPNWHISRTTNGAGLLPSASGHRPAPLPVAFVRPPRLGAGRPAVTCALAASVKGGWSV